MGKDFQQSDSAAALEGSIENDPSLVPTGRSTLLVPASLLDPLELQALLADWDFSPETDSSSPGQTSPVDADAAFDKSSQGSIYEPHPPPAGRSRGNSKLPSLAWLFPHHAGAGRP